MKYKTTIAFLAVLAVPHFAFGEEADKPVKFEALPAAVAAALKGAAGEAKLEKIVLGDEDGTPAYEAAWQAGGHKHEIAIAKDGIILGQEEIITLAETPDAVRAAMTKEAVSFSEDGKILGRENPDAEKKDKEDKDGEQDEKSEK